MNPTLKEFMQEVAKMRAAQKTCRHLKTDRHATSSEYQEAVALCAQAERVVDWWLRKLSEDTEQTRMFVE